jgi:hypothetical protein
VNAYEITCCLECGVRVWRNVGRPDRDIPRIKAMGWVFHLSLGGEPGWTCPECSPTAWLSILFRAGYFNPGDLDRMDECLKDPREG